MIATSYRVVIVGPSWDGSKRCRLALQTLAGRVTVRIVGDFKDPDGHALEILQFPSGKGDPRWHRAMHRLFLGIDHTAIAVADTTASLAFYRDALGMRIAGTSENWGLEQERLNNVPGAHLRITTLKATSGPGVEFLEFVSPRDGRRLASPRANGLTHWEVALVATDARRAAAALRAERRDVRVRRRGDDHRAGRRAARSGGRARPGRPRGAPDVVPRSMTGRLMGEIAWRWPGAGADPRSAPALAPTPRGSGHRM
jgi:catechol 2,3-dioxygenase-like lactoylglutathione lyase family enzyme